MHLCLTLRSLQAAFLLPIIDYIIKKDEYADSLDDKSSPVGLIVAPTRELAVQIYEDARKLSHGRSQRGGYIA